MIFLPCWLSKFRNTLFELLLDAIGLNPSYVTDMSATNDRSYSATTIVPVFCSKYSADFQC